MTAIKELYISKSFCMVGDTLKHCFNCGYCRHQNHGEFHYHTLPTEISPILTQIPIVINCFYGDPVFQRKNTYGFLKRLNKVQHRGPIIIITKGDARGIFSDIDAQVGDLDLHIALSTIGCEHKTDTVSWYTFKHNVDMIAKTKNVKFSCEFRPIIYGVNDNKETIDAVFKLCSAYNLPVGYSGLQGDNITQEFWRNNSIPFEPFPGYHFSIKKPISEECHDLIVGASDKYSVPIFRKTSCLISHVHGLPRDYNAHYYRPNEMECHYCVMNQKCSKFKIFNNQKEKLSIDIPFEYKLEYRHKHKCLLHDTCPHPHSDCTKINGKLIVIDEPITTADVRVIKWLTGYTVAANFTESNFISEKWRASV
jgi:hypothetical protein